MQQKLEMLDKGSRRVAERNRGATNFDKEGSGIAAKREAETPLFFLTFFPLRCDNNGIPASRVVTTAVFPRHTYAIYLRKLS